jgi:hypothetical protein
LIDENRIVVADIGVNFFLHKEDIGHKRAEVVLPRLQELNPLCSLHVAPDLTDEIVHSVSAVVITQPLPLCRLIELDELCRATGKSFFLAISGGVSVSVFVDHGPNHIVFDADGERPVQKLITGVASLNDMECLVHYETPEGQPAIAINNGHFEISEVLGVNALNGQVCEVSRNYHDPVKTVRIRYAMRDCDMYQGGGILTEKKLPNCRPMQSLAEKFLHPGTPFADPPSLVSTDLLRFGAEQQQHVAFFATLEYFSLHGHFPYPQDLDQVLQIANSIISEKRVDIEDFELDENFIKK